MSGTKRVFEFEGIDGAQFLGFLAGLGICRALALNGEAAKLGWRQGGGHPAPQIETRSELTRADVSGILFSAREELARMGEGWSEAFSRFNFTAETYRQFAVESLTDRSKAGWGSFVGAEAPVLSFKKGERQFRRTNYYFISGQQTFPGICHGVAQAITLQRLEMLFDERPGEIPLEDCACLRFEPAEVEDHALRFINPSKDTGASNVALNFLALCALPLFSALPSPRFVKCVCNSSHAPRGEVEMRWRLWQGFVTMDTAVSLQRIGEDAARHDTRGYAARAVKAVRGQTYMRMLPSVRQW